MKKKFWFGMVVVIALISVFGYWQNNDIVVSNHIFKSKRVPVNFDGFRIVHISDLHNKEFGAEQVKLIEKISEAKPDIIVVTGDIIDRRKFDLEPALEFAKGAVEIAETYYVCGNHEIWSGKYDEVVENLRSVGVHVLENKAEVIEKNGELMEICGMADPGAEPVEPGNEFFQQIRGDEGFKILLSHRPELFEIYKYAKLDLAFTGHAHGGQFRLPGVGGLVAPDQGLFPKYTAGSYTEEATTMYVSRGLGNSIVPVRVFNRPEVVVVELKSEM